MGAASETSFESAFQALTGNPPFPWQRALFDRFLEDGSDNIPASCNLPTGLGKTSVIAIWLIALARGANVPRRLVYVVNRRTVVDQTTVEVERYRERLLSSDAAAKRLAESLRTRCATLADGEPPLAVSTLRGQFADNRQWSADPSRPAVICGTVDMIGSRLLFSGYGVGMKARPLHAGFLGQDALLVHDEAHLEPAFQSLIRSIETEQRDREPVVPWPKFRAMELTATSRSGETPFGLTDDDHANVVVHRRVHAKKVLRLHEQKDKGKLADQLAELALGFRNSGRSVCVFARTVVDVLKVRDRLAKEKLPIELLTGTMRGKERDELVEKSTFARFLPKPPEDATQGTVYLVCTSAGEVGVNISADHLICDLSTFESMAQRFGRVNRFGLFDPCEIHVVYPAEWDDKHPLTEPWQKTLALLRRLTGDGSPSALGALPPELRSAAFAPEPTILPATDILFDAWALTTIADKLPGRPKAEPYLHGVTDDKADPPETHVAWREEVAEITGDLLMEHKPKDLLEDYPLRPHELLREPSYGAFKHFEAMAKRLAVTDVPVWLVDDDGSVEVLTLKELADKDKKDRINGMTVLLPPCAGGLSGGMLDGTSPTADDVADDWFVKDRDGKMIRQRKRLRNVDPEDIDAEVEDMHSIREIEFPTADDDAEKKTWEWFVLRNEGEKSAKDPVTWEVHVNDVVTRAKAIVVNLPLSEELKKAVITAAEFHDHGKRRKLFQTVLGNTRWPKLVLAKSGKKGGRVKEMYRHEFGSLVDVELGKLVDSVELQDPDWKELVLHLIAAHHGRGRPHFPADESFDPDGHTAECERIARDTPRRFARLQRQYGRWGLAYLESLLRAADWAASGNPSAYLTQEEPK
jgi:CRISPR-associated endonuclease/helicase Cas3